MDAKCIIEMEGKRTSILNLKVVFVNEQFLDSESNSSLI